MRRTPQSPQSRRRWPRPRTVVTALLALSLVGVILLAAGFAIGYQVVRRDNLGQLDFATPLVVPPLLEPETDEEGRQAFDLRLRTGASELLPGTRTVTWGVNGDHLGPTLRMRRGDHVAVRVTNELSEASSLHWHGMRVPARMDGGPHQEVRPGGVWIPEWTVRQPAATLWYHPHPHGRTAEHVYRGLAGMIILEDERTDSLTLPSEYGVDDVPLIVQDKDFDDAGQFDLSGGGGVGILGDEILVNGTHDPHFEVTASRTRLRVLNGSTARVYDLGFVDGRHFQVVATDTGLLPAPVERDRVRLSPGERAEIVVEMDPGERAVLRSFPGGLDAGFFQDRFSGGDDTFDIIQLRAADRLRESPPVPRELGSEPVVEPPPGATVRAFELSGTSEINGRPMDMGRVDEVVPAGATEIWEVRGSGSPHNFHIHDVSFRILDVDGAPPPAWLAGPKDTVYLPPGALVRLAVDFGTEVDEEVPYMYHCHLLAHEDAGMMGQFLVVPPERVDTVDRTLNHPSGGHSHH
ncbi:multicopper oxidase family protein [Actinoalloteichus caeruleus]|uniref:multicopper oxidase family protein n=1 Tax=Actinoalloteichus cyanogriseus TaxID=2893586 RepID=UPI000ACC3FD8|nr:multicopper oxidase domain-containing protein [Actinoalloteichus caeruleus]